MQYKTSEEVLELAAGWHLGQTRWDGDAYIGHPKAVAGLCLKFSAVVKTVYSETILDTDRLYQCAILHDVLEDCNVTKEDMFIKHNIDPNVVIVCNILNKNNYSDYTEYVKAIIASQNDYAAIVKYFDIQHNSISLQKGAKLDKYKLAQELLRSFFPFLPKE